MHEHVITKSIMFIICYKMSLKPDYFTIIGPLNAPPRASWVPSPQHGSQDTHSFTTRMPRERAEPMMDRTTEDRGTSCMAKTSSLALTQAISYMCFTLTRPATSLPGRGTSNASGVTAFFLDTSESQVPTLLLTCLPGPLLNPSCCLQEVGNSGLPNLELKCPVGLNRKRYKNSLFFYSSPGNL